MVGMEWLVFVNPTALCVIGLILALTLLWGYVMFSGGKKDQPNLSLLYEATSGVPKAGSGTTAKKTSKTRTKKYIDGSPRGSPKSQQIESDSSDVSSKTKKAEGNASLPAKDQTTKYTRDSESKVKVRKIRGVPPQETDEKVKVDEPDAEGEWQTQLSRQQLRALRQKKRGEGDKVGTSSDSDPTETEVASSEEPSKKVTNQKKEAVEPLTSTIAKASYNKGGRRGKNGTKKQRNASSDVEPPSNSDRVSPRTKEKPDNPLTPTVEDPPSSSIDQRLPSPSLVEESNGLTEVERALREAAQSGSEFIETGIKEESEFAEVKTKRRKKSKRKNTQALKETTNTPCSVPVTAPNISSPVDLVQETTPDIPSPQPVATAQELEDWVVI